MPIYVTDSLPVNNLVTFQGDNLITFQGDNLVAATDGLPDLIEEVYVGNVVINRVYVGADLVHERDQVQVLSLTSDTDVNLSTWLGTQAADPTKPIIINFADGQIIGGTVDDNTALNMGDLSAYTGGITFNWDGQVQGKQGYDSVWAQDDIEIINLGEIAGDIVDGPIVGGPSITIVISATGKILPGGGNGGNGGNGGYGDDITSSWTSYRYSNTSPISLFALTNTLSCWWDDDELHTGHTDARRYDLNVGGYVYERGSFVVNATYYIRRATGLATGTKGSGGSGGLGQGYTQAQSNGTSGTNGSRRAGDGGDGGNGGVWGVDGSNGSNGGSGTYYTKYSSSNSAGGTSGASGSSAGNAITSTASVVLL